jgi:hypothetical protein
VWHLTDLPESYHTTARGAEPDDARTGSMKALPSGCPVVGLTVDEMPHSPSMQDHRLPGRPWRNPVEKAPYHQSDVWQQADRRSEPATEEPPALHQLVHQRLRTTMDIIGREHEDQARPWTNCRYWGGDSCWPLRRGAHCCLRLRSRRLRRRPCPVKRHVREPWWDRGLIFGLIRLRSPTFIGVRINAAIAGRGR